MKVLILHQHFNTPKSGGALRSYFLAKALADRGVETIVLTGCNDEKYSLEIIEGIEIHYLPVPYKNSFGFGARIRSFLKYNWQSIQVAKKIRDVDFCYAISVPLTIGLTALYLKRKKKWPYIFEVGDLWPDVPIEMGFIKNRFLIFLLHRLEKIIYKNAQSIVAVSVSIQQILERKIPQKKIDVISNMADCDFYYPEIKDKSLEEKFNVREKFVVSYIGTIGVANGLEHFIACAEAAQQANLAVHFMLCGDGAQLRHLKLIAQKQHVKNISFTGFLTRAEVREVMNITDAMFISFKNFPILQTGSPNKYFDGLAAGKLIITNISGWMKDEVERVACGFFVSPENVSDFAKKIEPFLYDKNKLNEFQHASRNLAESRYDRKKITSKFVALFDSTKSQSFPQFH